MSAIALTPVIRDVSFLGYEWRELADGCLWELVPQSSPSPIYQYFPLSALVEYWEPRLPTNSGQSFPKILTSGMAGLRAEQT